MEAQSYSIVFSGLINPELDRNQVAERFAAKARMPIEDVHKMFASRKPIRLKSGLNKERAESMKLKLAALGVQVSIESDKKQDAPPPLELVPLAKTPEKLTLQDAGLVPLSGEKAASSGFACPACGQPQAKAEQCINCGIVFSKVKKTTPQNAYRGSDEPVVAAPPPQPKSESGSNIKSWLGLSAGSLAAIYLILKKLGFLKLFVVGAAAVRAFHPMIADASYVCLGDKECIALVNEKGADCWNASGLGKYDWDAMSDAEYDRRYKELESEFFSCLTYPDGHRAFLKPAYLNEQLADYCGYNQQCLTDAKLQQHYCYDANNLGLYTNQLIELPWDEITRKYRTEVEGFMHCFVDGHGDPWFPDFNMDD